MQGEMMRNNYTLIGALSTLFLFLIIGAAIGTTIYDAGGGQLSGVGDPLADDDAATKNYVDSAGNSRTLYRNDGTSLLGTFLYYRGSTSDCDNIVYADKEGVRQTMSDNDCQTPTTGICGAGECKIK